MSANRTLRTVRQGILDTLRQMRLSSVLIAFFSSGVLAFGLYNIHAQSGVTEGGILGLTLFLEHWLHISPSVSGFILNCACYVLGWKLLGKVFLAYSAVATGGFSLFYGIFEQFDPLFPQIGAHPLLAAVVGALFVGVSCGMCVRVGGAPSGDDALAMSLCKLTPLKIQQAYMISDLVVLAMSLSYIPVRRIAFSLLTVILSGQIIGWMQNMPMPVRRSGRETEAA